MEKCTDKVVKLCRGLIKIFKVINFKGDELEADPTLMLNFYKSFIRSKLQLVSIVYDSARETNKEEVRIQHRALETILATGT